MGKIKEASGGMEDGGKKGSKDKVKKKRRN